MFALATLITDESVRLRVLEAIFPKMHITATPTKLIDKSWQHKFNPEIRFNDAFNNEMAYRVTGRSQSEIDRCAAQDVATLARSQVREVRFRVYQWTGDGSRYVAVVQYEYLGAIPAFACPSIARICVVAEGKLQQEVTLESTHHHSVNTIQLVDLTGDGVEELAIESDYGGAGSSFSLLFLFELRSAKLVLRRETTVVAFDRWSGEEFVQRLDVARTREMGGTKDCFTKTTYVEEGVKFAKPRITYPCYQAN